MRIFFKSARTLQALADEHVARLRASSNEELCEFKEGRTEEITLGSRLATIYTISEARPDGHIRVVVKAFMKARLIGSHVALEGFYRLPDGKTSELSKEDYWEFS